MNSIIFVLGGHLSGCQIGFNDSADLAAGDRIFKSESSGGFTGFHDWLRRNGKVVGVRFWPHEGSTLDGLLTPDYVDVSHSPPFISVYFEKDKTFAEMESADQAFGFSRFMTDATGLVCLVMDTETITDQQVGEVVELLHPVKCRWV